MHAPASARYGSIVAGLPAENRIAPAMPSDAIAPSPLASPSSPSIRLNAFTAPSIQNTVRKASAAVIHSDDEISAAGTWKNPPSRDNPAKRQDRNATAVCPRNFSHGGRLHLSSA